MNKEVIKKWVDALRSGEYIQGRGALRSIHNRFCCLGVLCDLHCQEFNNKWDGVEYLDEQFFLPVQVLDWVGLSPSRAKAQGNLINDPEIEGKRLSRCNDEIDYSFLQIADLIENKYLK